MQEIKHVCFDLNKTLINENTWLELNQAMGMTIDEDQFFVDLYNAGKLSYLDWQKELEKIYINNGKATKENILKVINNYTFVSGAKEIINYLSNKGYVVSIISGSIDFLVEKVAKELGVLHYLANNSFIFDQNNYLTKINCLGEDTEIKAIQLSEFCQNFKIDIANSACVGDGDNDLKIFKLSQHGITFKGSKIEKDAWRIINQLSDIQSIL